MPEPDHIRRKSGGGEMKKAAVTVGSLFAAIFTGLSIAQGNLSAQEPETYHLTPDDLEQERVYSPHADRDYPDQVFFGDTHLTEAQSHHRSPPSFLAECSFRPESLV
jgi:hypothetical protein